MSMNHFSVEQYERLKAYMKEHYDFTPENMHDHEGYKKAIKPFTDHPESKGGKVWKLM